jgi:hypothetical protein
MCVRLAWEVEEVTNMEFDNPSYLWLILIIAPVVLLFLNSVRLFRKFAGAMPQEFFTYSSFPSWIRRGLCHGTYVSLLTFLVLGLAEPYIMVNAKDKEYKDIRLIFVLDVSRSMVYAEDIPPNRLAAMKQQVRDFYSKLDGVYECAILPFAGDANPYFCPLTKSRSSFITMLDELDWRSAPSLGTDLNKAMESVRDVYVKQDKIDKSGFNIIILISDGGKEEAIATNKIQLLKVSRELASKNFKIYTIGVGGKEPCPLVLRDAKGSFTGYVMDNGRIATSQLDEEILRQLAEIGHGKYYSLNASAALASDLKEIVAENQALVTERIRPEKLPLQGYLFSVTVCLLFGCLLLNKI